MGWVPGQNLEIEYRWHAGDTNQAKVLAKELVEFLPDVLVANTTPSLAAMQQANSTISENPARIQKWADTAADEVAARSRAHYGSTSTR